MKGFTLIEIIIAMSVVTLISLASVQILFLSLNLRDQNLVSSKVEESLRVMDRVLRVEIFETSVVSGGGSSLFLRNDNLCWSFVYDSVNQKLNYAKTVQSGCTPEINPSGNFFPSSVKISSLSFVIKPLSSGGVEVKVNSTIQSNLPLGIYQTSFSNTYLNLVDQN